MWELIQQRQRWVSARYGVAAFEDKPLVDGYTAFDMTDGGHSITEYQDLLAPGDLRKISFLINKQAAEHDDHHYIRVRPHCPTCRGSKVFATLSLCAWLMTHPGRLPHETSDDELNWDTEQVDLPPESNQAELYMSLDELSAMRPPHDLIDGIIPARGVGYITGRDRSLKTFLALDICLHVATMMPSWHEAPDKQGDTTVHRRRSVGFGGEGKILFAAGEGVTSFSPRITAWIKGQHVRGYDASDIFAADGEKAIRLEDCQKCATLTDPLVGHVHHVEYAEPDNLENEDMVLVGGLGQLERGNIMIRRGTPNFFAGGEDYRFMLAYARRARPDVIVIDTLALASGGADQQSNSEMGQIHERARLMAEASGGVVIIIAHTDKGDNDARGASAIEDNADFVIHCNRESNDELEVTVAKRKDAEDNWSFMLAVEPIEVGFGTTSLILHDWDAEIYGKPDPELEAYEHLVDICGKVVMTKRHNSFDALEVTVMMGEKFSVKTAAKKLDQLVTEGVLQRIDGKRGAGNKTRWHFPRDWVQLQREFGHEMADVDEGAPA